jgi:Mrp family chromosome partitioning ATPase
MERLQEALSRARERREKAASGADPSPVPERPMAAPSASAMAGSADAARRQSGDAAVAAAWAALPNLQINEKLFQANRIVSYFGGREASPFDMLRTKLVQQTRSNGWRRIAVTSPNARCGKTTVALNLAFSLARQADLRTLLLETDFRRPTIARTLGIKEPYSFARVLAGQEKAASHMVKFGGNVAFAVNHVSASNPAELLQSASAKAALKELEATFAPDIVLFDTAPLLSSDDTLGFLENVDAALLVAASELSTIEEVDVSESELADVTQVMGVVLNKSRYFSKAYSYEYGYY